MPLFTDEDIEHLSDQPENFGVDVRCPNCDERLENTSPFYKSFCDKECHEEWQEKRRKKKLREENKEHLI